VDLSTAAVTEDVRAHHAVTCRYQLVFYEIESVKA